MDKRTYVGKAAAVASQFKKERDYWLRQLAGEWDRAHFPYTYPYRDKSASRQEFETLEFIPEDKLFQRLLKISNGSDARLHVIMVAVVSLLLSKYTGLKDIITGTPVYKQGHDVELVNTVLALRNAVTAGQSFKDLLLQTNQVLSDAAEHQNYPMDTLLYQLNLQSNIEGFPLFDTAVLLNNIHDISYLRHVNPNLIFVFNREPHHIKCELRYNPARYGKTAVERIITHFSRLLDAAVFNVDRPAGDLEILTEQDKEYLLHRLNDTEAHYPNEKTLHHIFEEKVARYPANIALVDGAGEKIIDYRFLDDRASCLAAHLKQKGIGPDDIVAVLLGRSIEMIIAILGILKAGGAYLPLDPEYPPNRIAYMLQDSAAGLCITTSDMIEPHALSRGTICMDKPLEHPLPGTVAENVRDSGNLAYIIYTSGTTGNPKGVMIEHRHVVRLLFNDAFQFDFDNNDTWSFFHSYCFDFSVWEMFGALLYGGKLVIIPKAVSRDTQRFMQCLMEQKVTVLSQTPSAFYQLMGVALERSDLMLRGIRYIIFGGEALNPSELMLWRARYPRTKLINMYGITETTVHVTFKEIGPEEIASGASNIGRPIPTLTTYVVDRDLRVLPLGVPGELVVGGDGVARGYLNRPALTAEKFVFNPYKPAERIYRSGDLCRISPGGDIEYLGRIDRQIKIRGFRIELGEIENRLMKQGNIKSAVVSDYADDSGDKYLCAYIVPHNPAHHDELVLKNFLVENLPEYMVPLYIVEMDRIPLTPNGKVDRNAFPRPELEGPGLYLAPANKIEHKLVEIWSEVLGIDSGQIGVGHNFFQLGGHSLKATSLILMIRKELEVKIPLVEFFRVPTIRELARIIDRSDRENFAAIPVAEKREYYPLSSAQSRFYSIYRMYPQGTAYNVPQVVPLESSLTKDRLEMVFRTLIERHDSFRTSFDIVNDVVVQRIHEEVDFCVGEIDLTTPDNETSVDEVLSQFVLPFDLAIAPLLRVGLIMTPGGQQVLIVDQHHIISDGVSNDILVEEFSALLRGQQLKALRLQYKDFSQWQHSPGRQAEIENQRRFWLHRFQGRLPRLRLPVDFPGKQQGREKAILEGRSIKRELTGMGFVAYKDALTESHTTPFVFLFAVYNILMAGLSGQEDIISGTAVAGRSHADLLNIIGLFFNTLAMRTQVPEESRFSQFLEEVGGSTSEAFTNPDYPFERLVRDLTRQGSIKRDAGINPLFNTMFSLHNFGVEGGQELVLTDSGDSADLPYDPFAIQSNAAKFDLLLNIVEHTDGLYFVLDYATALFKEETALQIMDNYLYVLEQVIEDGDIVLSEIRLRGELRDRAARSILERRELDLRDFWLEQLSGDFIKSRFPGDNDFPSLDSGSRRMESLPFRFSGDLFDRLDRVSNQSDVRLFVILLSGVTALLNRYSGAGEIILGAPIDRQEEESEFVNTVLILKNAVPESGSFKELLMEANRVLSDAVEHVNYPLETLLYHLDMELDEVGDFPLFDIVVLLENLHDRSYIDHIRTNMNFVFRRVEDGVEGVLEYNGELYGESLAGRIAGHLERLLESGLTDLDRPLSELPFLSEPEREEVLVSFNRGTGVEPLAGSLIDQLDGCAARYPDRVAVAYEGHVVTYGQLLRRVGHLTRRLHEKGVKRGSLVGLLSGRSIEMVVGILGILRSGGAYLPLSPSNPVERNRFMLKDSGAGVLLTGPGVNESGFAPLLELSAVMIRLESIGSTDEGLSEAATGGFVSQSASAEDLAYVIYTSGSTGRPKGVEVEHRNVLNLVSGLRERIYNRYGGVLNISLVAPYVFDASVQQLFASLLLGHTLFVVPEEIRVDGEGLLRYYRRHGIDISDGTPSHLRLMLASMGGGNGGGNGGGDPGLFSNHPVKHFVIGGEALPHSVAERFLRLSGSGISDGRGGVIITNVYGPTECCVDSTSYDISAETVGRYPFIPIGIPMPNEQVYILDSGFGLKPAGAWGELCIGGGGVSRGYLNRPVLSAEKFVANPFAGDFGSERLYRTGDMARWLADGNIEFLGRMDGQVQLHGFRIEIGEIENQLLLHEAVEEVLVLARGAADEELNLCAYYVSGVVVEPVELRAYLLGVLPEYMIPAFFVQLGHFPLTANGKIDLKALPLPDFAGGLGVTPPKTPLQEKLVELWSEVLGVEKELMGIDGDFFEMGGHSLKSTILISRLWKEFKVKVPIAEIFIHSTIRSLSDYIGGMVQTEFFSIEPVEEKEYYAQSSAQKRLFILNQLTPGDISYNLPQVIPFDQLLEAGKLLEVFRKIILRHESLRTSFDVLDEEPVQRIHDDIDFKVQLRETDNEGSENLLEGFVKPFDLRNPPLLRACLININNTRSSLLIDMHHIITDGVSHAILEEEFLHYYAGGDELPPLRIQYKDYTGWSNDAIRKPLIDEQQKFWLKLLGGENPGLNLPYDYPRPSVRSSAGCIVYFSLTGRETGILKKLAQDAGGTLFMAILSAFTLLLSKLCGQEDIIVGTAVASRGHDDLKKIIGMFVNTLALPFDFSGEQRLDHFFAMLKERTLSAYENQEYPFEELVDELGWERDFSRTPVFDVMLNLLNFEDSAGANENLENLENLDDLLSPPYIHNNTSAKFDLTLIARDMGDRLTCAFEYSSALFIPLTIERFIACFRNLIHQLAGDSKRKLSQLEIMTEEQKHRILVDFNDTSVSHSTQKNICQLFEDQVKRTPDHIALIYSSSHLTYRELNGKAAEIACILQERGAVPDSIVALKMERSLEMIIAILGILKTGAAYLPIDHQYPRDRIDYILKDSSAKILIDENIFDNKFDYQATNPTDLSSPQYSGDSRGSLAYIMYTSGTTGRPKGVMIEHPAVVNHIYSIYRIYQEDFGIWDRCLGLSSISFDVSVLELFLPFVFGASLTLFSYDKIYSPSDLSRTLIERAITFTYIPPAFIKDAADELISSGAQVALNKLFVGVEPFTDDILERYFPLNPSLKIINAYGPTETTVCATAYPYYSCKTEGKRVPIGGPLSNIKVYLLDKYGNPVPVGIPGELYISGAGLSRGYLNNPELTARKFIHHHRLPGLPVNDSNNSNNSNNRLYQSGDIARWLADGNIEFLGRWDQQVKVRGYRIELGEIEEVLLEYPLVDGAVVKTHEDKQGEKFLCGYILYKEGELSIPEIRTWLESKLPEFMIPEVFIQIEEIPLSPNGKVDKKALPAPDSYRPKTDAPYSPPSTRLEMIIRDIWKEVLGLEDVGINDRFFDLGGNSLKSVRVHNKLKKELSRDFSLMSLFQYPTIHSLGEYLTGSDTETRQEFQETPVLENKPGGETRETDIAVIGMAGTFPGAADIGQYWENLINGIESITFFSGEDVVQSLGGNPEDYSDPSYIKAKGLISEAETFDSSFFGYTPSESMLMDPQIRLFHRTVWEALENGGYYPDNFDGLIGLYAGASPNLHWEVLSLITAYSRSMTGVEIVQLVNSVYLTTAISYKLNLKGPCLPVFTACSTSLAAIDNACLALMEGRCHMALAGGVSVITPRKTGYYYQEGMIMSSDGRCRAFDESANGTVAGEGSGAVLLKPLSRALSDNDTIHAVIKGTALNNDGGRKIGFSAPSIEGQAEVIRWAQKMAGAEPETIGYIETHGTGTALGDPVEIEALNLAFDTKETAYCPIGSVKTNIGHLDTAAGIAAFIKTVLILKHHLIPPSLHFETPNPQINFGNSPFYVNSRLARWERGDFPRRAGVSSFGIGGNNVHIILQEAPDTDLPRPVDNPSEYQLLLLSARGESALGEMSSNLSRHFQGHPDINPSEAAFTLQVGRKPFNYRQMSVCSSREEAIEILASEDHGGGVGDRKKIKSKTIAENPGIIFMFPGQGSQYTGMARDLYRTEPLFRETADQCFELLKPYTTHDLKSILYPEAEEEENAKRDMRRTEVIQPLVFVVEYALARLLMSWGISPRAMIGLSLGEYVAASISGVFSLAEALKLIACRGGLMQHSPPGAMLSVPLPEEEVKSMLEDFSGISMAIINGPSCVVSGSEGDINAFGVYLKSKNILSMPINTDQAGHGRELKAIANEFEKVVRKEITFQSPRIPFISSIAGGWCSEEQARNPRHWAGLIDKTIRFSQGIAQILKEENIILIEVGPGSDLISLAQRHIRKDRGHRAVNLLPPLHKYEEGNGYNRFLLNRLGRLWLYGASIDWNTFWKHRRGKRIPLPTYYFEPKSYPIPAFDPARLLQKGADAQTSALTLPEPGLFMEEIMGTMKTLKTLDPPAADNRPDISTPYVEPQSQLHKTLVEIWKMIFDISHIGIDDDFFQLGGDSLKATRAVTEIHKQLDVEIRLHDFFTNPTPKGIARLIEARSERTIYSTIQAVEEKSAYPLSAAQRRLYVIHQMEPEGTGYNSPMAFTLTGGVEQRRLEEAFKGLIRHHESLRTTFHHYSRDPVQTVHDAGDLEFEMVRWRVSGNDEENGEVDRLLKAFVKPFDLTRAPLLRAGLIDLGDDHYVLTVDIHHIIFDAVSEVLLMEDFMALYRGEALAPLPIQYKDYACWQNSPEQQAAVLSQEKYWLNRFIGNVPTLRLPYDFPRPSMQSHEGHALRFRISPELAASVNQLVKSSGATLYMVLLAAVNVLLHKLSGGQDIVVGSPMAGRRHADLEKIVGMFVNMLAMRNFPSADKPFAEFLREVKTTTLEAFENQEYQFEDLVDRVVKKRDLGRNPLFDVVFNLLNVGSPRDPAPQAEELSIETYGHEFGVIKFDLLLAAQEVEDTMVFSLEYCTRLFKEETIRRWSGYFIRVLEEITGNSGKSIAAIDIPPEYMELKGENEKKFEQEAIAGGNKKDRDYWLSKLSGDINRTGIPYTHTPSGGEMTVETGGEPPRSHRLEFTFSQSLSRRIVKISRGMDAGLLGVLCAALNVLLHKYTGSSDVIIGVPVYRQNTSAALVNTVLALRNRVEPGQPFKELLQRVNRTISEAYDHQNYPIVSLAYQLSGQEAADGFPLFDVSVLLANIHDKSYLSPVSQNMVFQFNRVGEELVVVVEYNPAYYSRCSVERLTGHLNRLLDRAVFNPAEPVGRLEMLPGAEKEQLLETFNDTAANYPREATLQSLFSRRARQTPGRLALSAYSPGGIEAPEDMDYRQLDDFSNKIAVELVRRGVGPGTIVALLVDRSLSMIAGILGILKAGGAYLPIDIEYPRNRVEFMLRDSAASLCLTSSGLSVSHDLSRDTLYLDQVPEVTDISQSVPLERRSRPDHLAYIIYTSGTTGNPKGVLIEHRNVVRLLFNEGFQFAFDEDDVWTMFHSYCFDFSVWEMYGALLYGGKLVVLSREMVRDTRRFAACLRHHRVSVLNQTPSSFYLLMEYALERGESLDLSGLRYVIFGGEALNPGRLKRWRDMYPKTGLINMYGITETTVHVTFKEIGDTEIRRGISNIGKAIATLTTYVMNPHRELLPVGVPGELAVGGEGVARGYLNRPGLTAEKFVYNPYKPGERLYRSGDLVRLLESGDIEYLGRIDSQVKIRGYRIEMGEIENRLMRHENVKSAVVIDYEDSYGETFLCAYVVAENAYSYDVSLLRDFLNVEIPEYMVPHYFVRLERIPLTANGKVDRKSLPEPELSGLGPYVAAVSATEQRLVALWSEVLDKEPEDIGVEHGFFELGGHSLKATSLVLLVHRELDVKVPLAELFRAPTIRRLAVYIDEAVREKYQAIPAAEKKEYYPMSSSQSRFYTIYTMNPDSTAYNIPLVVPLQQVPEPAEVESLFQQFIDRHESFRTSFEVVKGVVVQRVHDNVDFSVGSYEIPASETDASLEDITGKFILPFDLSRAPLLRVVLVKAPAKDLLVVDMHHIITDGVSSDILMAEYVSLMRKETLAPLRLQYKDFSQWQNSPGRQAEMENQRRFWLHRFQGRLPRLRLPVDYPDKRRDKEIHEGRSIKRELTGKGFAAYKDALTGNHTTPFVFLFAVYNILMAGLSGQEDIISGTAVAGRSHADLLNIIGLFFNTLAMRTQVPEESRFCQFLEEVGGSTSEAFANPDYPFERLVQDLTRQGSIKRDAGINPLFNTMFSLHNFGVEGGVESLPADSADLPYDPFALQANAAKFDLLLNIVEQSDGLYFVLDYATALFKEETAIHIMDNYLYVLEQVIEDGDIVLSEIRLRGELRDRAARSMLESRELDLRDFWLEQLSGDFIKSRFPGDSDFPSLDSGSRRMESLPFRFSGDLFDRLDRVSNQSDVRLFVILLSGVTALLNRYSGAGEIFLGAPIDRQEEESEFVNTVLILKNAVPESGSFKELLMEANRVLSDAVEHVNYPLETLLYHLDMELDEVGDFPLFDIVVLLENLHDRSYIDHIRTNMNFVFRRVEDGVEGVLEYNEALYGESLAGRIVGHLERLLESGLTDLDRPLSELPFLSEPEREEVLVSFNRSVPLEPFEGSLIDQLNGCAALYPDRVAVAYEGHVVTYGQLLRRVGHVGRRLHEQGVNRGSLVGLLSGRSIEMVVGILGILRSGAAYLPLSPSNPVERNRFMLEDSGAEVVLTGPGVNESGFAPLLELPAELIRLESIGSTDEGLSESVTDGFVSPASAEDLAYVIYTSGSTGRPKGVEVEHRNVLNLVSGLRERIYNRYGGVLNVSLVAPYVFDASVQQLFASLLLGHTLFVVPEEIRVDGEGLLRYYCRHGIDISDGTPSHLRLMLASMGGGDGGGDPGLLSNQPVKHFVIGGEALPHPVARRFLQLLGSGISGGKGRVIITNVYGPTECCVDSTSYDISAETVGRYPFIPIGKPMPNEQVYILDSGFGLKPVGAWGELCIGGGGVSRGYLNRPGLSAEKFVANPFAGDFGSERLYRTGDMARWLADGNIEFLGRMDGQVQLRGFRIEIGEIENQLLLHEAVEEVFVTARGEGDEELNLCAYYVSGVVVEPVELRAYLLGVLPEYMIPAFFVQLGHFPLTANGKIDLKALPVPDFAGGMGVTPPKTPLQEKLVELWSEVLGVEKELMGIDRDFFEMGGHSLKATSLILMIHKELNVKISLTVLFKASTIRQLAEFIDGSVRERYQAIPVAEKKEYYPLSSAQNRFYTISRMEPLNIAYNSPQYLQLQETPDKNRLEESFRQLIKRHASFRTSFAILDNTAVQMIRPEVDFHMEFHNSSGKAETDAVLKGFVRPFDVSRAPLIRAGLLSIMSAASMLMVDIHHIISDGISSTILIDEFERLYRGEELPPLKLRYVDFAQWQNSKAQQQEIARQERFWLEKFAVEVLPLNLPTDFPRASARDFSGGHVTLEYAGSRYRVLKEFATSQNTTVYYVMLSVYFIWLSKLTGQEDLVVGTAVSGRRNADLMNVIGLFFNTLALRKRFEGGIPFMDFLKRVVANTLEVLENQDYPFDRLVRQLSDRDLICRDSGRNPLFDTMFAHLSDDETGNPANGGDKREKGRAEEDKAEEDKAEADTMEVSKLDLLFNVLEKNNTAIVVLQYSAVLYKQETIEKWLEYYGDILDQVLAAPYIRLQDIEISASTIEVREAFDDSDYLDFNI